VLAMEEKFSNQHTNISRIATNLRILRQRLYDDRQLRSLLEDSIESLKLIHTNDQPSRDMSLMATQYGLTHRELEVLELLLEGRRPQIIAKELYIALNTVRRHLSAIFRKLNVKSQLECIEKFAG